MALFLRSHFSVENSGPPPQQVGPTEISSMPNSSVFLSFTAEDCLGLEMLKFTEKASELDGDPNSTAAAKHALLALRHPSKLLAHFTVRKTEVCICLLKT